MRISTWNLLAPEFTRIEGGRDFYALAHPWDEWPRRHPRLLRDTLALDADLLCLQELSSPFWSGTLHPALERAGYQAHFTARPGTGVGVAIAWRCGVLRLEEAHPPAAVRGNLGRSVAVTLRSGDAGPQLTAMSVHLDWSPDPEERRLTLDAALAVLNDRPSDDAQLLAGDVNFDPHTHADWPRWAAEGWQTTHPMRDMPTWAADGRADRLDAVLIRGRLTVVERPRVAQVSASPGLPSEAHPSDHVPLSARLAWTTPIAR